LKTLLVTGTLAEKTIKQIAKESNVQSEVLALKVPVAAFLTPRTIIEALKNIRADRYDLILVPGLIRGDAAKISEAVGVPAFKGPRYAADLPTVLDLLSEVQLSSVTPACELLGEMLREKAFEELAKVEQNKDKMLKKPHNMLIKELAVGKDYPMRVLAEIVDAALMPNEEIQRLSKRYVQLGADLIDVGMVACEDRPADAERVVRAVKEVVDVPVSIDTLNPAEIEAAVSAGADLILSVDAGNLEQVAPFSKKVAVVAIPTNQREGYFPKEAQERVSYLEEIIRKARKLGITRILGDLILEPSNILESFIAFREFAGRNPCVPLFVGVSNVTELMDADSVGINALLARLSAEVEASVILATEKSSKARGTVAEEITAAKMMFLAKKRGTVPKDLGIDLLVLKDKRNREEPYQRELERRTPVTQAVGKTDTSLLDNKGVFRIAIDRQEEAIVAVHYFSLDMNRPDEIIKGSSAENIYKEIVQRGLTSKLDHAGYLGSELLKAEIALSTGKEYIQDKPLFSKRF
jgi:dihydropteroate synthase-like protein